LRLDADFDILNELCELTHKYHKVGFIQLVKCLKKFTKSLTKVK